jgi:hypothetical protein
LLLVGGGGCSAPPGDKGQAWAPAKKEYAHHNPASGVMAENNFRWAYVSKRFEVFQSNKLSLAKGGQVSDDPEEVLAIGGKFADLDDGNHFGVTPVKMSRCAQPPTQPPTPNCLTQ